MTQLLIKALEAAVAGPAEKKQLQARMVARDIPLVEKELGETYMILGEDGKKGRARDLLLSDNLNSTTLIQTEIYRTIIEGAEPAKCFRNALPNIPMTSPTLQINVGESGSYAPVVAEGAEIPIKTQKYTPRTWTAVKFGERPVITQEMVDDSLFAVIELETKKVGLRIENSLNQWGLKTMMDNAGQEHDINAAAGTVAGVQAIIGARSLLVGVGYIPDTIIMHPSATSYLLKDFVPGYTPEAMGYVREGKLPRILGCTPYECGAACTTTTEPFASSSYVWGAPTDSYIGYLVFDSKSAGAIGKRQDIRIKNFNDVIRDLQNFTVTARFAVQYGVANAISRVEFGGA